MTGIEKLHPRNHTLYIQVQTLLNLRWSYDAICDEIGLVGANRINDLCEWFIAYKSPKRLPAARTAQPITWQGKPITTPREMSQQFAAWRKQHVGARKAREAAGL